MTMDTLLSKSLIGRSALWSVLNQSAGQFLVLLVFLITARFVDMADFGVMAVTLMTIEAFRQVFIDSVMTSIYARKDPDDKYYNAAFFIVLGGSVTSAIIVFLFSNIIADFLGDEEIGSALRWISLLLIIMGLSKVQEAWLGKNYYFKSLALRSLGSITIGGGIGIWMAVQGYGITALIVQQLVTSLIACIWLWISTPWKPKPSMDRENFYSIFNHTRHTAASAFVRFADGQSDVFFSSYYLGSASTGVYNAGKRIVTAMALILNSGLNNVALPTMASLSGDALQAARGYLKCVTYSTTLTAPLYIGFAVTSPDFINVLLGNKWSDTAPIASILALAGLITAIGQYNTNIFLVHGKAHWNTYITLAGCIVNLTLFIFFARYGLVALAGAITIKTLILYPVSTHMALRLLSISPKEYLSKLWPCISASLIMAAVVYLLNLCLFTLSSWERLAIVIPAGGISYIICMFLFDRKCLFEMYGIVLQTWKHKS